MQDRFENESIGSEKTDEIDGKLKDKTFKISSLPKKTRYRPGESISFDGIKVMFEDEDVTDDVTYNVKEGTLWALDDKKKTVTVRYVDKDKSKHTQDFEIKLKRRIVPFLLLALALVCCVGGFVWYQMQPKGETGSYIIPKGEMTDEEAQKLVNDQTERSRITVSIRPSQELRKDGSLHVNFVVEEPNNGLSERLEIEQDGKIIYKSGVVRPGNMIAWGESHGAKEGPAIATVYAVDEDGNDTGNPASAEIEIVNFIE